MKAPTPFSVFGLNQVTFPNGAHSDERVDPWDCLVIVDAKRNELAAVYGSEDDAEMSELADVLAAAPTMLEALREVQRALACFRDDETYIHPTHGQLALEEVKYLIVDPAVCDAEGMPKEAE